MTWTDRYVYFWNIRGLGKSQVSRIFDLLNFQTAALALLLIKQYFPNIPDAVLIVVLIFAGLEIASTALGYVLEKKYNLIHSEIKFETRRNTDLQEVLSRLRRMEAKLKP